MCGQLTFIPVWRLFSSHIVLLLVRTNIPIRSNFLSIFLEDLGVLQWWFFVFNHALVNAGNHGTMQTKSASFQNQCLGGLRMQDQGIQSPQTFLLKNFLLTALKTQQSVQFQESFEYRWQILSIFVDFRKVQYYFKVGKTIGMPRPINWLENSSIKTRASACRRRNNLNMWSCSKARLRNFKPWSGH